MNNSVVFECACHGRFSVPAPSKDGEPYAIAFPRYYPPGTEMPDEIVDESHRLVARGGKWEIAE